jgi:hypothetical protein
LQTVVESAASVGTAHDLNLPIWKPPPVAFRCPVALGQKAVCCGFQRPTFASDLAQIAPLVPKHFAGFVVDLRGG